MKTSGQWACIAAEADDLLAVIREQVEREKAEKNAEAAKAQHAGLGKKLPDPAKADEQKTATKAAELFNTNRTPPGIIIATYHRTHLSWHLAGGIIGARKRKEEQARISIESRQIKMIHLLAPPQS